MAYRRRMQQDGGPAPPPAARPPPQTADTVGSSFDGTRQSVNRARQAGISSDRARQAGTSSDSGAAGVPLTGGVAPAPEPVSLGDTAATEAAAVAAPVEPVATSESVSNGLDPKLAAIFANYASPPDLDD